MKRIFLVFFVLLVTAPTWADSSDYEAPPLTFHGFPCTVDCSGHRAGYEWAARKSIASEENCGGKSNSFTEGCRAWVREQNNNSSVPDPSSSPPEKD